MNVKAIGIGIVAVVAAAGFMSGSGSRSDRLPVIKVATGDPEMEQARSKARASMAEFWRAHGERRPGTRAFALKVAIPHSQGHEHFWLQDVERKGDGYAGTIGNEPKYATQVKLGQRYAFGDQDISDWMFMREGKIVGNETMRPLLKRMPEQQAAQYRAMLERP